MQKMQKLIPSSRHMKDSAEESVLY